MKSMSIKKKWVQDIHRVFRGDKGVWIDKVALKLYKTNRDTGTILIKLPNLTQKTKDIIKEDMVLRGI